jgi:hypothetical protein
MDRRLPAAVLLGLVMMAGEAKACTAPKQPPISEARQADAVFVGYVTRYQVGARIDVEVDEVISGQAPESVTILWRRAMNYGPPTTMEGRYLFAVDRLAGSPSLYRVNQRNCVPALVFKTGSFHANAVRELFGLWPEADAPLKTTADAGWGIGALTWLAAFLLLPFALAGATIVLPRLRRRRADRTDHQ